MQIKRTVKTNRKKILNDGDDKMSFWSVMNWVAWGFSALLFIIITKDFISVEIERYRTKHNSN